MGIFDTGTRDWSIRVAINGTGTLRGGVLNAGEDFVQGSGHAEETIVNGLKPNEVIAFGGTNRNICRDTCLPRLNSPGMQFGGDLNGLDDKTPYSHFWLEDY